MTSAQKQTRSGTITSALPTVMMILHGQRRILLYTQEKIFRPRTKELRGCPFLFVEDEAGGKVFAICRREKAFIACMSANHCALKGDSHACYRSSNEH